MKMNKAAKFIGAFMSAENLKSVFFFCHKFYWQVKRKTVFKTNCQGKDIAIPTI